MRHLNSKRSSFYRFTAHTISSLYTLCSVHRKYAAHCKGFFYILHIKYCSYKKEVVVRQIKKLKITSPDQSINAEKQSPGCFKRKRKINKKLFAVVSTSKPEDSSGSGGKKGLCKSYCLLPVESTKILCQLVLKRSFYTWQDFKAFQGREEYNYMVTRPHHCKQFCCLGKGETFPACEGLSNFTLGHPRKRRNNFSLVTA